MEGARLDDKEIKHLTDFAMLVRKYRDDGLPKIALRTVCRRLAVTMLEDD
jgi:hypothetical protein